MCVSVVAYVPWHACLKVRGHLSGVRSLFYCGFWGLNLGRRVCTANAFTDKTLDGLLCFCFIYFAHECVYERQTDRQTHVWMLEMSCQMWVLGTERRSPERTVCALDG